MATTTADNEDGFVDRVVKVFRACAGVPTATRAYVSPPNAEGILDVKVTWSRREIDRGKTVKFDKGYLLQKTEQEVRNVHTLSFQSDATNIVKVSHGGVSRKRVTLVNDKTASAKPSAESQQFIEVWNDETLEKTIIVADLKDHGKINEDIHFGSFHVSSDGKKLLYVAEKKKPKATSFFAKSTPSKDDPPPAKGAEFLYESNWGEQLSSVVNPVPVVLDLDTEKTTVIDTSKVGDISAGQAVWVPGGEKGQEIVFIGWDNCPRKLGFVYCLCRKSAVYHANIETGECSKLTDSDHTVFSPRFNPQGSCLVYFKCEAGGPHHSCSSLVMIDWSSKQISTMVEQVKRPETPDSFPGFYTVFLPERCWDSSGTRLLVHNAWGSLVKVTSVDITSGIVTDVSGQDRKGAWLVMDVSHDLVVAQFASLNTCPKLFVGAFPDKGAPSIVWTEIASMNSHLTNDLTWDRLHFKSGDDPSDLPYEGLLLRPQSTAPPPLVVAPHGGPHVATPADFLVWPICLASLGFAVLMVNYRGSMGFGQENIHSLLGKIGTQDVTDVQKAAAFVVEKGLVDGGRVCVMGGSHGGFLTAHLIGQFPDFYRAGVLRNPVIDLATMWGTSDIPDWTCVECGITFDPAVPPSGVELQTLRSKSPITYLDKVKAQVLVLLGGMDLRVPPSQGLLYYNTLRAQGKQARLHLYPEDSHPISTVQSDGDAFINSAEFLHKSILP